RKDVREHGEVGDLLEGLIAVRELQQVEVGEGHHHVLGLPADPAAHVDVPVGRAGACGIDVEADSSLAFETHSAAATGDVEGHGADVAGLDEQHVPTDLHHLPGDLVAKALAHRCGGAATDHVLVAATDVR